MTTATSLHNRYEELRSSEPHLRIHDAAARLDSSEAELLALECRNTVTRLSIADWHAFIRGLKALGRVMVLTRNDFCVHEKTGVYENIPPKGTHVGLVTGKDIDLRLFYGSWTHAFAVETEDGRGQPLRSVQFFDAAGDAIHKVYLRNDDGLPTFHEIVAAYRSEDQSPEQATLPRERNADGRASFPDAESRDAFLDAWEKLEDTHDFFGLLKEHDIARLAAVEAAEGRFTRRVAHDAASRLLKQSADDGTPIMVFTGNPGAIQIHTGPVHRIVCSGCWTNVLDPGFNLHLREEGIASSWIVEKPTKDGVVTSVELFDADGDTLVQFFGERKPGIPERDDWRALAQGL